MQKTVARLFLSTIVLISIILLSSAPVMALNDYEYNVYAKAESFTWKEFDGGEQLVKESGPIFGVGGSARLDFQSLFVKLGAEVFGGTVDYDGQTQSGTPAKTDSDYVGVKAAGDVGLKFVVADNLAVGPFAGPGFRYWVRDIKNTDTVAGYDEQWFTFYGRVGLFGRYALPEDITVFAEGGAKLPIYNENRIDYYDVTLEPGRKASYFAEAGMKWKIFRVVFYYEGMRFSESDAEPIGGGWVAFQPKSEADMFGVNIGASF